MSVINCFSTKHKTIKTNNVMLLVLMVTLLQAVKVQGGGGRIIAILFL